MMMAKGNEDLKAKIAKIQQKAKLEVPVPEVLMDEEQEETVDEETEEESMERLEAEFNAKKKALIDKAKKVVPAQKVVPQEESDDGIDKAIEEYADDAKFRVEMVFQLVQLNKSMKKIADGMEKLLNNGE